MRFIIVDLDGTLCNESHRVQHGIDGDWDAYFEKLHLDEPHEDVLSLINAFGTERIIFLTCRPEKHRQPTKDWLWKHGIHHTYLLLMRQDGDTTPSEELKVMQLEKFFGSRQAVLDSVLFVLEDRDKVVKALREYGLNCWQTRAGKY